MNWPNALLSIWTASSDEWINSLQVEKVAGGQLPPDEDQRLLAELSKRSCQRNRIRTDTVMLPTGQRPSEHRPANGQGADSKSRRQPFCRCQDAPAHVLAIPRRRWLRWRFTIRFRTTSRRTEAALYSPFLGAFLPWPSLAACVQFFWPGCGDGCGKCVPFSPRRFCCSASGN